MGKAFADDELRNPESGPVLGPRRVDLPTPASSHACFKARGSKSANPCISIIYGKYAAGECYPNLVLPIHWCQAEAAAALRVTAARSNGRRGISGQFPGFYGQDFSEFFLSNFHSETG